MNLFQRAYFWILRWSWVNRSVEGGPNIWLLYNRKKKLAAFILERTEKYNRLYWPDQRGSLLVYYNPKDPYDVWGRVSEFWETRDLTKLPHEFFYERKWDAVIFSIDGTCFSISFPHFLRISQILERETNQE